jgi:hypothetical protein
MKYNKCNVGDLDRGIRFAAGGAALGLGLFGQMSLPKRLMTLAFAGSELVTGLTRYCPLNEMLGINTCEKEALTTGSLPGYIATEPSTAEAISPASVI